MKWPLLFKFLLGAMCLTTLIQAQPTNFILEGSIRGQTGSVQLVPIGNSAERTNFVLLRNKACTLHNGRFLFEGWIESPYGFLITYSQKGKCLYRSTLFVVDKGRQAIQIDLRSPLPILSNETMRALYQTAQFKKEQRLQKDIRWLHAYSDSLTRYYKTGLPDSLSKVIQAIRANHQERAENLVWELCEQLPSSFYAFWSLNDRFHTQGFRPEQTHLFSYFTNPIQQSKAGQWLAHQLNQANRLGIGKLFPPGMYKNLKTHQLESLRLTGKYTLMEFWWSGCGICLQQTPQLRNLHRDYGKKGFAIIGIATDKTQQLPQLEKLLTKYNFNWPEYLDENRINANKNGVLFYPTYLLLDHSGRIINNKVRLSELSTFLAERLK